MQSDSSERPDQFEKTWELEPMGDQPQAIESLVEGVEAGVSEQILLGVTGSVSYTHLTLPTNREV